MTSPKTAAVPIHMIGEYGVLTELSAGHTYLATGPGRRKVVLKRLDDDCVVDGRLHASIRERLQRIQEVPHAGVANLYGVEKVGTIAYLVWEFVDGTPLEEHLAATGTDGRLPDILHVGRELVMAVEGLHRLGLVHGSLHGGNIIVTPDGSIRLTHLSPYLYTDPQEDARAVIDLLLESLNKRYQPGDLPVHRLLTRASEDGYDLATLVPLLACPPDSPLSPLQMTPRRKHRRGRRRKSVLIALLILVVGTAIALAILHRLGRLSLPSLEQAFTSVRGWLSGAADWLKRLAGNRV